ncbi:Annexin [Tothia fuscella]|uniref:Annexin n=1 Tax=Tothia fuscella TaxID=1048955 RepID=A0A9P4NJY8_9PEZI|nr:Annexin [Tothia fuscella]
MAGYYPPNQGQQPGYNRLPPPPPQGHSPYPPQSQYPPQQQGQLPYGQAPMHNQHYPPQQGYPPFQQGGYGAPPQQYPSQQGYPPQGYPPQQQAPPYGAPAQGQYPPQQGYGAPPAGPLTPATPGYLPNVVPPTDMQQPAAQLRDSMKGFGTKEKLLIQTLVQVPDAPHMEKLRRTYDERFRRSLLKDIESETSGWFEAGLMALARGPLQQDAYQVNRAIKGLGTKESLLDDVCLGRSNADMHAIKQCYTQIYGRDMVKEIKDDLSLKTEKMYEYVLAARRAEESAPCIPHEIEQQVDRLQQATEGTKMGTNHDVVLQTMCFASDGQIRAISQRYHQKWNKSLDSVFKKEFTGHMQSALLLMLNRAVDRVKCDADGLEDSMKGMGTKDELLVNRLVRVHWNREHLRQVNVAYKQFYKKNLVDRVKSETSGDYKALVTALCQ